MAKTRHQKLHAQMTLMATDMNNFFNKLHWLLNQVPIENYWRHGKAGIRPLSQQTQTTLELIASAASSYFTSCSYDLKSNCQALGISRMPHKKRNADFVQKSFYQSLLHCCDEPELGTHTWFQEEEACDSISHQLDSISAISHEEFVLNGNLGRHPYPIFQDATYAWNGNSHRLSKIEGKQNEAIVLHEPPAKSTVALAWEHVKKILREGKHRRIEKFLKLYLSKLEEVIFQQIPWNDRQKQYWLNSWEDKLFKNSLPNHCSPPGRWQQGNSIEYAKAAKLLLYFVESFLQTPNDSKSAEVACILWLMLWCAYHKLTDIRERDIINLTTGDFLNNRKLKIRGHSFEVSEGLYKLLSILFGEGRGIRAQRIFTRVKNEKMLIRALEEASKIVLGHDEAPITPGAFLNFPHIWSGAHLSRQVRESMRNARHIIEPKVSEKYISKAKKILSNITTTSPWDS